MALSWLERRFLDNAPVAPLSSQQTAAHWEPSVQELVREIGGYKVAELAEAVSNRWAFKFTVSKVWRATDAISDKGLHSYIQHHWVIFKLVPSSSNEGPPNSPNESAAVREAQSPAETAAEDHATSLQQEQGFWRTAEGANRQDSEGVGSKRHADQLESQPSKRLSNEQELQLQKPASDADHFLDSEALAQGSADLEDGQAAQKSSAQTLNKGPTQTSSSADEQQCNPLHQPDNTVHLTTETSLSQQQAEQIQPQQDELGLQLAEQGSTWFLRIDRFNEADKWFACGSFEQALLSEQARKKHYGPGTEVAMEAVPGRQPLYLDCMVPLLSRLADVKYSVFAKGFHCQWHAKVVTCMAASLSYFLDPGSLADACQRKVTPILTSGREQQQYTAMAPKFSIADHSGAASYVRERPEAPYLKACLQDVKQLTSDNPHRLPAEIIKKPFPDLQLIYSALQQ